MCVCAKIKHPYRREQDVDWPVSNIVLSPEDEFNKVL